MLSMQAPWVSIHLPRSVHLSARGIVRLVAPQPIKGEVMVVNSILHLHRLLMDPDADPAVPTPIDNLHRLVIKLRPMVFTVIEQDA